jgi:hypothetical protein
MNRTILAGLLLLTTGGVTLGQAPTAPLVPPPKGNLALAAKPIQSHREVLAFVPADLRRIKATEWTQAQREMANAALKEALVESGTPGKLRLKVGEIAPWSGPGFITLFSEIKNQEGYRIRVFGRFSEDWVPKLATLKKGNSVVLEGVLSSVEYLDLWGQFTLSICLNDCTFAK